MYRRSLLTVRETGGALFSNENPHLPVQIEGAHRGYRGGRGAESLMGGGEVVFYAGHCCGWR